jgi:hypothetical protein
MMIGKELRRVGVGVLAVVALCTATAMAAPEALAPAAPAPGLVVSPAVGSADFNFGTEMVVHDWVLCVSQASAESIARARGEGMAEALAAYAGLKAAKTCGQFQELHVILRESLYPVDPVLADDARVFAASVNIGGGWPSGFLVYGGLTEGP